MKRISFILVICLLSCTGINSQSLSQVEKGRISLPNGWKLTPVGKLLPLGDLPLNMVVSPDKKLLAVTNNGESDQTIQLFDVKNEKILDTIVIGKAYIGLAFSDDSKSLYASGGNDNIIIRYSVSGNRLVNSDSIRIGNPWPEKISITGIALDDKLGRLYAVTKENNSLYVIDLKAKKTLDTFPLDGEGYTCILSPDRKMLYITCWGCDKVIIFDTGQMKLSGSIPVGDNPNDMCLTKNGQYLYIANANDNSVSVIDTRKAKVLEVLDAALYPGSPSGSTTNGVALSSDEKVLYIANADNNCLAVFDVRQPGSARSLGFIPTGWYPTCIRFANNKLFISNGKGLSSKANPYGPNPTKKGSVVPHHQGNTGKAIKEQYIGGLFRGVLQIVSAPGSEMLGIYSKAVYDNTPYNKSKELLSESTAGNPVPGKVGDPSPIKHVFYIIKENRTYDQVLGDVQGGNGDRNLVLFGEKITPNQHAIVKEFVLLDNFYVDGEVSADGHSWSMGAYATDFLEKNWPTSYGGRGGSYPGEGNREVANNRDGYLWDACARKNVTYRSYGEFVSDGKPNVAVLKNHFCKSYTGWDLSVRDTVRFRQWKHDFDSLLARNAVPQLSTIRFGNDHTEGMRLNRPTPFAFAADNDLAVGKFLDYLSHSSIWKNSLVIMVEDDAQNGPDHVDAHRSTAYIAGGFVKKGFIDHTAYTTSSLLRTIELILGLPPMTQYDAPAMPLWRCFNNSPDHPPFIYHSANVNLDDKNLAMNEWQKMSETFNFTAEDMVNDQQFNEVIWHSVKGPDVPCPPVKRAAFYKAGD